MFLSLKIEKELKKLSTKERAKSNAWFFKTGIGHESADSRLGRKSNMDLFLGVTVPNTRSVVRNNLKELKLEDLVILLQSKYHEVRLASVIGFVELMKKAIRDSDTCPAKRDCEVWEKLQKKIFDTYLKNTNRINNWDLVDVSASQVVGYYISEKMEHEERLKIINRLINSKNLWENRIIVVATFYQIKKGNEKMIYYVAEKLLNHKHDLMHKAIGWMLREVGKNCGIETLNIFLKKHYKNIPRTTLRYAIERHHPTERAKILKGIW